MIQRTLFQSILIGLIMLATAAGVQAAEKTVNKIIAVVNGEMITLHQLQGLTAAERAHLKIAPGDPREASLQNTVLQRMINDILLRHDAAHYKITVTDAEVDAEVRRFVQGSRMSQQDFEAHLAKQGTTMAQFKETIHNSMLKQRMVTLMVSRRVIVTPDEIKEYYEMNKHNLASANKIVTFSFLVFKPAVDADAVRHDIATNKTTFAAAAKRYSIDASADKGGVYADVPLAKLPSGLQQILMQLQPEEMSSILPLGDQKGLVRLDSVRGDGTVPTLAEATAQIEERLKGPRLEERFNEYVAQLRSKAVIDIRL